jgi:hypothetical protein
MANLVPLVDPANESVGIPVGFSPTAIFEQSMDEGSIDASSCFLVEISKHNNEDLDEYLSNVNAIGDIVVSDVVSERINLADENLYTGLDHGTGGSAGLLYRTKIYINPDNILKPNTTYAALLAKDLSLVSVFDPEPNGGNTGTGTMQAKGVYTGLTPDTYTVTVITSGGKNSAKYVWNRASDSFTSVSTSAKGAFVEIDQGLQLKFLDGIYDVGDTFVITVVPADKQQDIFSWTFGTGSGDFQTPDDERSDDLLNLPVVGGPPSGGGTTSLFLTKVEPENAATLVKIARKANARLEDVIFVTKLYTDDFNSYTVELTAGATAGAEVVGLTGTDITVQIEDGVSTAQQIVDAFNASVLVNVDFESSTDAGTIAQSIQAQKKLSKGVDQNTITLTFNKDVDSGSLAGKIKILEQPIYPSGPSEELPFTTAVVGNQVIITLQESS